MWIVLVFSKVISLRLCSIIILYTTVSFSILTTILPLYPVPYVLLRSSTFLVPLPDRWLRKPSLRRDNYGTKIWRLDVLTFYLNITDSLIKTPLKNDVVVFWLSQGLVVVLDISLSTVGFNNTVRSPLTREFKSYYTARRRVTRGSVTKYRVRM